MLFHKLNSLLQNKKSNRMKMSPFILSMAMLSIAIVTPKFIFAAEANNPNFVPSATSREMFGVLIFD